MKECKPRKSGFGAVLAFAGLGLSALASADDQVATYRVTGIIVLPQNQIAVIEKSDATQQLYRLGDVIDRFTVVHIDTEGVLLTRGSTEVHLALEGKPSRLEDGAASSRMRELQIADGNATQKIDYAKAQRELAKLVQPSVAPQSGEGNVDEGEPPAKTLDERLATALSLPSYTVITAVDRTAVQRADQAILQLSGLIAQGRTVRLEVGGSIPGLDVLYLTNDNSARAPGPSPSD